MESLNAGHEHHPVPDCGYKRRKVLFKRPERLPGGCVEGTQDVTPSQRPHAVYDEWRAAQATIFSLVAPQLLPGGLVQCVGC